MFRTSSYHSWSTNSAHFRCKLMKVFRPTWKFVQKGAIYFQNIPQLKQAQTWYKYLIIKILLDNVTHRQKWAHCRVSVEQIKLGQKLKALNSLKSAICIVCYCSIVDAVFKTQAWYCFLLWCFWVNFPEKMVIFVKWSHACWKFYFKLLKQLNMG